jgi:hypothetical protein
MFAGHIKVLGWPHVARGPDVAQACSKVSPYYLNGPLGSIAFLHGFDEMNLGLAQLALKMHAFPRICK